MIGIHPFSSTYLFEKNITHLIKNIVNVDQSITKTRSKKLSKNTENLLATFLEAFFLFSLSLMNRPSIPPFLPTGTSDGAVLPPNETSFTQASYVMCVLFN